MIIAESWNNNNNNNETNDTVIMILTIISIHVMMMIIIIIIIARGRPWGTSCRFSSVTCACLGDVKATPE